MPSQNSSREITIDMSADTENPRSQVHHASCLNLGGFLLTHGHKKIKVSDSKIKATIIGHEHPAISFENEFGGRKERFKAFIYVPGEPPVLVLPSVNPLAYGTEVNELSRTEFLSPYLKEKNMGHAKPYVLEVGELLLPFPELSKLAMLP